jgi:type I restriction enzyme S subunit
LSTDARLPPSWVECTLGDVVDYGTTQKAEPKEIPDDAWVLELEDIEKDTSRVIQRITFAERQSKSTKNRFIQGDVLYGKLRPYLNKVVRASESGYCTTEIIPLTPPAELDGGYLFHWLKHPRFLEYVTSVSHGLNMPRLGTDAGRAAPFILAPLREQVRIADKLDVMLARVDACRDRLDRVPAILKRFRQAVLAAATSGELSRDWRAMQKVPLRPWRDAAKNARLPDGYDRLSKQSFRAVRIEHDAGILPPEWSVPTIAELYDASVLLDFADGNHGSLYPRKEEFSESNAEGAGVTFLTATQMGESWELDLKACPRLRRQKAEQLTKGWARNGDVLLSHNATVGRVALLDGAADDVLLGTSVTFYRFNPAFVAPRFARIVFSSPFFQNQLRSVMEQTTRDQVPITKQVSLRMVCPPIEEQDELVRRVDGLLASAAQLVRRRTAAAQLVERLNLSLLMSAFRGALVPQDPDDEPASDLLAKLKAGQSASTEPPRRRPKTPGRRPTMSNTDKDAIRAAILKLKTKRFSFDELRLQVTGDYESLKVAFFELLEEPTPIVRQVFDEKAKTMQFVRVRP